MNRLKVGDKIPDISSVDQDGNDFNFKSLEGKKIALYFYPKDNTPGCTNQACNLRDNYQKFQEEGYEIVGISADSPKKHQNFIAKYNLPFTLLADENKELIQAFGVWGPKKFMGKEYEGIHRTTFIIDEQGIIEEVIEKVKTKEHTAQILKN